MLEKFGWSKGSGLGKNNQGISENIRVEHKIHPTGSQLKILFSAYFLIFFLLIILSPAIKTISLFVELCHGRG